MNKFLPSISACALMFSLSWQALANDTNDAVSDVSSKTMKCLSIEPWNELTIVEVDNSIVLERDKSWKCSASFYAKEDDRTVPYRYVDDDFNWKIDISGSKEWFDSKVRSHFSLYRLLFMRYISSDSENNFSCDKMPPWANKIMLKGDNFYDITKYLSWKCDIILKLEKEED